MKIKLVVLLLPWIFASLLKGQTFDLQNGRIPADRYGHFARRSWPPLRRSMGQEDDITVLSILRTAPALN